MIRLAFAGAAFAALAAFPVSAQPPAGGPPAAAEGPETRAQVQLQIETRFKEADANHDGVVTAAELGDRGPQMMERLDADHDGKLTLAELSGPMLARFDRADTNHDGIVTPEERAAFRDAMRARMQQQAARRPQRRRAIEHATSSPAFAGEGDRTKCGGGASCSRRAPPPCYAWSPSPGNPGED